MCKKKKHIFIEKPITTSFNDLKKINKLSKKYNVMIMTGHILLYHPAFIKLQQLIKKGYIGKIKYIYSIRIGYKHDISTDDITWDYGPHDVSMIQHLIKYNVKFIKIISSKLKEKIIEAHVKLIYKQNVIIKMFFSWTIKKKIQKLKIIGEKKILIFNDANNWYNKLQVYDNNGNYMFNIKILKKEPLLNQCQYFFLSVKNKREILSSSQNSEKNIKLIETITNYIYFKKNK